MHSRPTLPWERADDRGPLAARMAADAARAVVERRYPAGMLLTEADLAVATGASRTPAREAMLQLEAWGLVRLAPKKGAVVTAVTVEERRDLLAARAMFEIEAVAVIARGDADLAALAADIDDSLRRQRTALERGDLVGFAGGDYAFHARIIASGGNAVVGRLLDTLGPRLARLTHEVVLERPDRLATLLAEHEELAERAGSGDAVGFAELVRRHIAAGHFPGAGPA
ncbi:GntR family transcriptional regulator [Nakamurella leprariae]|uniref:GntR family transcriptional regulator n=1 Tax=Nakamurella leprariae TaxID=2803911 RepID=A0A939BZY4_9ACTN|nr:GntR family transcriptional regulator [Nakamurella leprariae]MBM9468206.1 GntR family transcriptional regulator [Nakamurella leprariae]